jgi:uncharacterized damage-inducible protein DinB
MDTIDIIAIYRMLARYNSWVNNQLGDVCAALSDVERKTDRHAPFRSIHGLWNHLLLTDRVWLGRFHGTPFVVSGLDQELYSDFEALRRERVRTDEAIAAFVANLTAQKLADPLHYVPISNPTPRTCPLFLAVQHMFNHQTHHRGQMTALLDQMDVDFGVTDLFAFPAAVL